MSSYPYKTQDEDGIPTDEHELLHWLQNFAVKIPIHGPTLGLTDEEVQETVEACNRLIDALLDVEKARMRYEEARGFRDAALKFIQKNNPN